MTEPGMGAEPGPSDQHAGTVATENPSGGRPGERHEVGDARSSRRDPPHVTDNDEAAPVQAGREGGEAPVLPANASGRDSLSTEEQDSTVDEESAYDRRPTQDKDKPASGG
jgi:hypothetical protein